MHSRKQKKKEKLKMIDVLHKENELLKNKADNQQEDTNVGREGPSRLPCFSDRQKVWRIRYHGCITKGRVIKKPLHTMNSKRGCVIKIRMSEEDIVEGEVTDGVIGNGNGFTGEESRETGVAREEEEVGESETLWDDMVRESERVQCG